MLLLDLTPRSRAFLDRLDPKQYRQVVRKVFELSDDPQPPDSRPLHGLPFWRADIGEHRIIYQAQLNILKVYLIEKRNDDQVYKKLDRL